MGELKTKQMDENFDFIKFLDEVRLRYDLSPTPLVAEKQRNKEKQGQRRGQDIPNESLEQLSNQQIEKLKSLSQTLDHSDTVEFRNYFDALESKDTRGGIVLQPHIMIEKKDTNNSSKTAKSLNERKRIQGRI